MYEIDSKKRYNVTYVFWEGYEYTLKNVQLKVAERNFIVVIDKKGKEHICTGVVGIYLTEV